MSGNFLIEIWYHQFIHILFFLLLATLHFETKQERKYISIKDVFRIILLGLGGALKHYLNWTFKCPNDNFEYIYIFPKSIYCRGSSHLIRPL